MPQLCYLFLTVSTEEIEFTLQIITMKQSRSNGFEATELQKQKEHKINLSYFIFGDSPINYIITVCILLYPFESPRIILDYI